MAKISTRFICQQCGYESAKWMGKCTNCGEWNSFVETIIESKNAKGSKNTSGAKPQKLSEIKISKTSRTTTKISELDRVLGGGIVSGQVILLAGEPGVGKSTILLQLAGYLGNVLYVSGEESLTQIKLRAQRLGIKNNSLQILESNDVDDVVSQITSHMPELVIVDSIQTMATSDLTGLSGAVGQVRESASRLVRVAKQNNIPVVIVGHVTKEGSVAGPAVLAHIVDTVIWFEGDKTLDFRLLRAVKNRFGPTDEVGIFQMQELGLTSVEDASKLFLSDSKKILPGSCITSTMEGTRPILIEIQSLVVPTKMAFAKRVSQGIDQRRVELLLAILQRRAGIPLYEYDVFVNVVGGLKVSDPGSDLAICLSLASAYKDIALPKGLIAVGEVDLLGEIRPGRQFERVIKDAKRQGYKIIASSKEYKYLSQAIKDFLK